MLHDPSHRPQPIIAEEIKLASREKEVLRRLVAEVAEVAALPSHREKAELWQCLNDLNSVRPMVWINELPWHEMNVDDELTLRTQHPWAREWETTLRQTLYQWKHLPSDIPWLSRWGLNYYGCCEPLDFKLEILRRIPRLRKISMNYRIKPDRAAQNVGADYVFSYKPSPALLAGDRWRPEVARAELRSVLEVARGCHVELIMKDISTVRYEPHRLWEWAALAMEEAERFAE